MSERIPNQPEQEQHSGAVVLFDVDNTLLFEEDFSIFSFANFLTKRGFPDSILGRMHDDLRAYREKDTDYRGFATAVVDNYCLGLRGLSQEEVTNSGNEFLPLYEREILPYSRELIDLMNQWGETIVVSGAPKEAFLPLGKRLRIKQAYLLEAQTRSGIYTGETKVNMALDEEKRKVVQGLNRRMFNRSLSFAFGDSIHDLPLLEAVANPFVVGSRDLGLVEVAQRNDWEVVNAYNIIDIVSQRVEDLRA